MKIYSKILTITLILLSQSAIAQFVSVPYSMHTPYGNVPMSNHVYMPSHYNGKGNPKFDFTITLKKNDSIVHFKSRMLSEKKKLYVNFKQNKTKTRIYPAETKQLFGYSSRWGKMEGIPADSCWLFKVTTGAINGYSSVPVVNASGTIAIQDGKNGEIDALTKENLEGMVGNDDEQIVKWLNKNKLLKVIEYYNDKNRTKVSK